MYVSKKLSFVINFIFLGMPQLRNSLLLFPALLGFRIRGSQNRIRLVCWILISFNSKNGNDINTEIINNNNIKNHAHIIDKSKHFDRDKNKLIKLKLFLWPNYRLEDLACINRYWFDTNNASRFSMIRIHICPRLKIR